MDGKFSIDYGRARNTSPDSKPHILVTSTRLDVARMEDWKANIVQNMHFPARLIGKGKDGATGAVTA